MRIILLVGLAFFVAANSALAEPVNIARMTQGRTYFNQPHADMALHDRDIAECSERARLVYTSREMLGYDKGLLGRWINSHSRRAVFYGALENCMVVRGWRVVQLPEAEGAELAALPPADLKLRLAPWVGAETPYGAVVRVWGNDALRASTVRLAATPEYVEQGSLSAIAASAFAEDEPPGPPMPPIQSWQGRKQSMQKKIGKLAAPPPGYALVIGRTRNGAFANGINLSFHRQGPDVDTAPSSLDGAPDLFVLVQRLGAKPEGDFVAVAVPPGRWRIAALNGELNFCLGSPAFTVAAGEVVYLGTFDLGGEDMGPDLSLGPVKAALAGLPAADQVRPAVYENGSTGLCGDYFIYALEFRNAPFETGYVWGGAGR